MRTDKRYLIVTSFKNNAMELSRRMFYKSVRNYYHNVAEPAVGT